MLVGIGVRVSISVIIWIVDYVSNTPLRVPASQANRRRTTSSAPIESEFANASTGIDIWLLKLSNCRLSLIDIIEFL
jgi:hypothetical protein